MNYDIDLWNTIQSNTPQEALYRVGEHIKLGTIEVLENTWVYALSHFASFSYFNYYKFHSVCKDVLDILEKDTFQIADAFSITMKLCFLYKNTNLYTIPPKLHIHSLRKKILGFFSDDLKLSTKGIQQFQSFLPKNPDEQQFCIKLLSGLIALWTEKKHTDFRNALEYIDRKHFEIELPSNIHLKWGTQHYTMSIFVWECLCLLEPSFTVLKSLYQHQYSRKNHRNAINFMLVTHTILQNPTPEIWSEKEKNTIHNVMENCMELFEQIQDEEIVATSKKVSEPIFAFENFFPTTFGKSEPFIPSYTQETKSKTIVVKSKSKEKKYKESKIEKLPYE